MVTFHVILLGIPIEMEGKTLSKSLKRQARSTWHGLWQCHV